MAFYETLSQILALLQRDKRVSYRALKRQFALDDEFLEDIKAEIIQAKKLAVDEDGAVLVWSGGSTTPGTPGLDPEGTPLVYTPLYLTEKILASRSTLEGERKQITVLFADLKGSTDLIAGLDPEEARQLLDPALHAMMEAVHRYEGTVNQIMGDGIMALFGAPLAHEDHAVRACYAALAMQESMQRYSEEVRRTHGLAMQIRVGLDSGEVVVRAIHNDLYMDYSAVGQTTHLAARMEQLATPGTILLTAATLRLAEGLVRVNALGPMPVKGLGERVDVCELVGASPARRRLQAAATRGFTRLVGRQYELTALHQALEQAHAGHGQVVVIVGEPGVGKSRLVWEFVHASRTRGWLRLESGAVSYGRSTPYLPVRDLLKACLQVESRDTERQIREKVLRKLSTLEQPLESMLSAVLTLLDVPSEDALWQALDPPQRRQRTLDAVKRLLLRESQGHPVLLVCEDLHWIDAETQVVLDSLVESLPGARLLLLVTCRPTYQQGWGAKTYYTQLRLEPLPPESTEEFLQVLLGDDTSLTPLKPRLVAQTEGNPFFLEESIRTLVETRALVGERGAYRLAQGLPRIQVPATAEAIMAARIDRLPPKDKHLLQLASVIGKDVPFTLLQTFTDLPEETLRRGLMRLQGAEFLYEASLFPELEYTFKHALLQEVAYKSLLEQHRRVYHAVIGRHLETLYAGRTDGVLELLAHHFGRSTEDEKAVDYALLAAEKILRRWASSTILAHLEAALKRLQTMPDTPVNRLRRIDAVLHQGEARFALGRHAEHIAVLESIRTVVDEAADPRRRATWYYWMGFLHSLTGSRPEVAIAYCREAVMVADIGGFDDLQAIAESCLAQAYVCAGDLEAAMAVGERALATFETRGHVWWACRTLWQLITAVNAMGEWRRGLEYCRRALEHGRAVDDLRLKVVGWCRTGSTHIQRGDPEIGLQCCDEALALSPIPFDTAMIKAVRGHGLVKIGKMEAGIAELTAAVAWFEQSRLHYTRWVFALRLGEAYLRQGERLQARARFEAVLTISQEAGYRHLAGVAERFLGETLMPQEPAAAAAHLTAAVQLLEEIGARNEMAKALVAQAHLCRATGDLTGARRLLDRALVLFETLGTLDEPRRVQALLATLEDERYV